MAVGVRGSGKDISETRPPPLLPPSSSTIPTLSRARRLFKTPISHARYPTPGYRTARAVHESARNNAPSSEHPLFGWRAHQLTSNATLSSQSDPSCTPSSSSAQCYQLPPFSKREPVRGSGSPARKSITHTDLERILLEADTVAARTSRTEEGDALIFGAHDGRRGAAAFQPAAYARTRTRSDMSSGRKPATQPRIALALYVRPYPQMRPGPQPPLYLHHP